MLKDGFGIEISFGTFRDERLRLESAVFDGIPSAAAPSLKAFFRR